MLKTAFHALKAFQGFEQLQAAFSHLLGRLRELVGVLDRESDSVHRDAGLVSHLKFHGRRARVGLGFDHLNDLVHDIGSHLAAFPYCRAGAMANGSYGASKRMSRFTRTVNL